MSISKESLELLKIGHCPFDIDQEDEGDPLPEPHCHANRDGDCTFAYCPQPLLKAVATVSQDVAPEKALRGFVGFVRGGYAQAITVSYAETLEVLTKQAETALRAMKGEA